MSEGCLGIHALRITRRLDPRLPATRPAHLRAVAGTQDAAARGHGQDAAPIVSGDLLCQDARCGPRYSPPAYISQPPAPRASTG